MEIPDPLHPAMVHFPIVLLMSGLVLSILCLKIRNHGMLLATGIVFTIGAISATVAVSTGEKEGEAVFLNSDSAEQLLDAHQEWAETTRNLAWSASIVSITLLLMHKWPKVRYALSLLLVAFALITVVAIYETGHRGGKLVYANGAGVNMGYSGSPP